MPAARGYFQNKSGEKITIPKYMDKKLYKEGNGNMIIHIPDLVIDDSVNDEVINIEGKKFENMNQGIEDLENFDFFDNNFINKHYPDSKIIRTVVLFGGENNNLAEKNVSFLLNNQGQLILSSKNYPKIFGLALENLFKHWAADTSDIINFKVI